MAGSTFTILLIALLALGALAWLWRRERNSSRQADAAAALAGSLLQSATAGEVARCLEELLPQWLGKLEIRVYRSREGSAALERIPTRAEPEPAAFSIADASDARSKRVAACFTRMKRIEEESTYVFPALSRREPLGVIEITLPPGERLTEDELEIAEVAALQAGAALRLAEIDAMRQSVQSSERQAAAGQLISGTARELHEPLERLIDLAETADGSADTLAGVVREARRAREVAERLMTFADPGHAEYQPMDLNVLLTTLLGMREDERRSAALRVELQLSPEPAWVMGSRGQLEQAFLMLLVAAEQKAEASQERSIAIKTSLMSGSAAVEISFVGPKVTAEELTISRAIVDAHGGELKPREANGRVVLESTLPLEVRATESLGVTKRQLPVYTVLIVEPDLGRQREVVSALARLGQRAVPVPGADEALDLCQRHRFDLLLCTSRLLGTPAARSLQQSPGAFVFLNEPFETATPADDVPRLRQPVRDLELRSLLEGIASKE
jgi:signal transduction histidine kinase